MKAFANFLKKKGKKPNVVIDLVFRIREFKSYLNDFFQIGIPDVTCRHIDAFTEFNILLLENPKNYLRAIALYFQFNGQPDLANHASLLRENFISQSWSKFRLQDFKDASPLHIEAFKKAGIIYVDDILKVAVTHQERFKLAQQTGLPYSVILEYARLADLTRIGSVKKVRARLYYLAGFDTIKKIAAQEPEIFRQAISDFITKNNYDAIPPTPKEAVNTINTARKLKSLIN